LHFDFLPEQCFCARALLGKIWFSQARSFFSFGLAVAKVLEIPIWFSRPAPVGFVPVSVHRACVVVS
jgi:hypothetical protein